MQHFNQHFTPMYKFQTSVFMITTSSFMLKAQQKKRGEPADTHVLVRSDQEAMVDVSLHQTSFTHTLLSQHNHFGIHPHHGNLVWKQKNGTRLLQKTSREGGGLQQGEKVYKQAIFILWIKNT